VSIHLKEGLMQSSGALIVPAKEINQWNKEYVRYVMKAIDALHIIMRWRDLNFQTNVITVEFKKEKI
jgi:hypothetical protein